MERMKAQMMQNPEMQRHMEMLKNNPVCVSASERARSCVCVDPWVSKPSPLGFACDA